jgi:hypothetical protein
MAGLRSEAFPSKSGGAPENLGAAGNSLKVRLKHFTNQTKIAVQKVKNTVNREILVSILFSRMHCQTRT